MITQLVYTTMVNQSKIANISFKQVRTLLETKVKKDSIVGATFCPYTVLAPILQSVSTTIMPRHTAI